MRMLALAQAWKAGGRDAVFLSSEITPALEERIKEEGFRFEKLSGASGSRDDLEATIAAISRYGEEGVAPAVALDGYQFDADFQHRLRKAGHRLLVVDDYGLADGYKADWVLNQNISAKEELYSNRRGGTHLLLGPKYALLRNEFSEYQGWRREIPQQASKILVTLGGADADNVTGSVMGALANSAFEVKVVVGGSNPHLVSLRKAADALTEGTTRVELVVNASNMPALMAWADVAVAAGGSTAWELAFTGLPPLFIILAENQAENARQLQNEGFGMCLGESSKFDERHFRDALYRLAEDHGLRADFALRGRELVDGFGADRVVSHLLDEEDLRLRPMNDGDFRLLWMWANDPATRANSFESAAIPWEQHRDWCQAKLDDPACSFWMAIIAGLGKIGCVRFDRENNEATISVSLSPKTRGRGYGQRLIKAACDRAFQTTGVELVNAFIKPCNKASIAAFARAGFRRHSSSMVKGQPAEHYRLDQTQ